jgi:hypothetical protein
VNLSSGGLSILAIAVIWFLVFLPSFVKGDQSKQAKREKTLVAKEAAKTVLSEGAQAALKARRARTILVTVAVVALVVAGLSVLEVIATGTAIPLAIGSGVVFGLFTWLSVKSHGKYVGLLSGSIRRSVPVSAPIKRANSETEKTNVKVWQPEALPKQSYLQTGAIEVVELAEVVSIENEKPAEEIASIDEILRRRRHVG